MILANHVIIIPGLGNEVNRHEWVVKSWKKYGIIPHVFDAKWHIEENGFPKKLDRALKLVDSLIKNNSKISIVGNSAGSSFALNIFGKRKKQIRRIVVNCGRVRKGDSFWFTFDQASATSPSFKESVIMAEKLETTLTKKDREKILTLRPLFDEAVPSFTVPIRGAKNNTVFSVEHMLTIALNMTLFKKQIIDFLLS